MLIGAALPHFRRITAFGAENGLAVTEDQAATPIHRDASAECCGSQSRDNDKKPAARLSMTPQDVRFLKSLRIATDEME